MDNQMGEQRVRWPGLESHAPYSAWRLATSECLRAPVLVCIFIWGSTCSSTLQVMPNLRGPVTLRSRAELPPAGPRQAGGRGQQEPCKDKCKVLPLGRKSPWQRHRLGAALLEGTWGPGRHNLNWSPPRPLIQGRHQRPGASSAEGHQDGSGDRSACPVRRG